MPASKRKHVSDTSSAANSSSPDYSSLDSDDAASYSSDSDLDASESASAGSAPAVKVANLSFNQCSGGKMTAVTMVPFSEMGSARREFRAP